MFPLQIDSREGVVHDISDTLATRSSLVHVVMNTHCWFQNDSVHDLFVTFKSQFLTRARNFVKTDVHLFFYSILLVRPVILLWFTPL